MGGGACGLAAASVRKTLGVLAESNFNLSHLCNTAAEECALTWWLVKHSVNSSFTYIGVPETMAKVGASDMNKLGQVT